MLYHHAATSAGWTLLFHSHEEARDLWGRVCPSSAGFVAACLMPDHVHVLDRSPGQGDLARALASYAQWRNHRRGVSGPVWRPMSRATPVKSTGKKAWRSERYVNLDPGRAALTECPLRWPWSTYRDAVGMTLAPVRAPARYPGRYHASTVDDREATDKGLPMWSDVDWESVAALEAIRGAVSSLTRTPGTRMWRRGDARSLFVQAARTLTPLPANAIARHAGMSRSAVYRTEARLDARVRLVQRVAGDTRYGALEGLDVEALRRWLRRKRARTRRQVRGERDRREAGPR